MDHSEYSTERMELKHDAVPGYPLAYNVATAVAVVYLAIILISTL